MLNLNVVKKVVDENGINVELLKGDNFDFYIKEEDDLNELDLEFCEGWLNEVNESVMDYLKNGDYEKMILRVFNVFCNIDESENN